MAYLVFLSIMRSLKSCSYFYYIKKSNLFTDGPKSYKVLFMQEISSNVCILLILITKRTTWCRTCTQALNFDAVTHNTVRFTSEHHATT